MNRTDGIKRIKWSFKPEGTEFEYMLEIWYKPLLYRFLGVVAAVLSVFSYLGIIGTMPGVTRDLSVYYLAVHDDTASAGGITVFVLFTLIYTAYVVLVCLAHLLGGVLMSQTRISIFRSKFSSLFLCDGNIVVVDISNANCAYDGASSQSENDSQLPLGQCTSLHKVRRTIVILLPGLDL